MESKPPPTHQPIGESKGYALLIEDNADIRMAMRSSLTQGGVAVIEAANGTEAVEAIHFGNNPLLVDVVLINTDSSDGIKMVDYFRRQFPSISLIGLTGQPSSKSEATQRTNVVILGAGKGGSVLLDLLNRLPRIEIIGIADKDSQAPALQKAKELGIPISNHIPSLISKSEVHLIVDVTGDPTMDRLISEQKHPGAEVLGGTSAKLLWDVVQYETEMRNQIVKTGNLATMVRDGILIDYLIKPVETNKLIHSVKQAIQNRKVHET